MAFGSKSPGLNNTTRNRMKKLVKGGYTPQEISDDVNVVLSCVLSFYQEMTGKDDEEMEEYSLVDNRDGTLNGAEAEANRIIDEAKKEAERIIAEAEEEAEDDDD